MKLGDVQTVVVEGNKEPHSISVDEGNEEESRTEAGTLGLKSCRIEQCHDKSRTFGIFTEPPQNSKTSELHQIEMNPKLNPKKVQLTIREFVTVKRMTKHEEKSEEDDVDKKENLIMTQIQTTTTSKNIAGNKKTPKMKVPRTIKTRKSLTNSDQKPITSFFITRNQAGPSSSSQTKDPQTIKDEE